MAYQKQKRKERPKKRTTKGSSVEAEDLNLVRLGAGESEDLAARQAAKLALVGGLAFCHVVKKERVPNAFGAGCALLANDALEVESHGAGGGCGVSA